MLGSRLFKLEVETDNSLAFTEYSGFRARVQDGAIFHARF